MANKELTQEAMKMVHKGYTSLTEIMIDWIFAHETETSYLIDLDRWYVSKYNDGHFIHYRFIYTAQTVTLKFLILPYSDKPQYIPFMKQ